MVGNGYEGGLLERRIEVLGFRSEVDTVWNLRPSIGAVHGWSGVRGDTTDGG